MKVVIQRVSQASVAVDSQVIGKIGHGLCVFVGVAVGDTDEDTNYLVDKIINLRIFEDTEGKFNLSALDVKAELLLVSQFTLLAATRKGRRPGFTGAELPEKAVEMFEKFVAAVRSSGLKTETGKFQAHMDVALHNDGPVTIIIDSRERLASRNS
ncbi:MAG TPA: D-aminoacyl-tRNA deacylase [Dehalococcoidales bacterium]|nr:D-aminoacyl-tRNA deacylase [Dehalococcoidales bacterium]